MCIDLLDYVTSMVCVCLDNILFLLSTIYCSFFLLFFLYLLSSVRCSAFHLKIQVKIEWLYTAHMHTHTCTHTLTHTHTRGGTTRVVQYGAIDHVLLYKLSRGVVLFSTNCTTRVVPPLHTHYRPFAMGVSYGERYSNRCYAATWVAINCIHVCCSTAWVAKLICSDGYSGRFLSASWSFLLLLLNPRRNRPK